MKPTGTLLEKTLTTAEQKRRAFWLVDMVTPRMRDRALLLSDQGIEVQFFSNCDSFLKELDSKRAGIIIVSDHEAPHSTEKILTMLMNTPEIQGAKMIYTCSKIQNELRMFAAALSFRDIVPDDLDDKYWLHRIRFAVASKPINFQQPAIQTSMHQISALSLPARLVWIAKDTIRLECRAKAPVGSSFFLSGPLADAFGVSNISLTVRATTRSNLLYRFSDALICEWSVPTSAIQRTAETFRQLAAEDPGPRCRIFVAAQSAKLRKELVAQFDDPRFEISTALQKNSIANDPKFFSPDMVLIESSLCSAEGNQFDTMMRHLPAHSAVAIFGKMKNLSTIRSQYAPRTIIAMNTVPKDIRASALNRFMPIRQKIDDLAFIGGYYIPSENNMSLGEISFPTRMIRIHPTAISLGLPFPIVNFALARVDCPYIRKSTGRNPIVKVTNVYRSTADQSLKYSYIAEGYLADVSPAEQRLLAETIVTTQSDALKIFQPESRQKQEISFYRIPVAVPPPPSRKGVSPPSRSTNMDSVPAIPKALPIVANAGAAAMAAEVTKKVVVSQVVSPEMTNTSMKAVSGDSFQTTKVSNSQRPVQNRNFLKTAQRFAEPAIDLESTSRGGLRNDIDPMFDVATEIKDDFVQGVIEGVQSDVFKSIIAIFLTLLAMVVALWLIANHVAPAWERSGSRYSEKLKELTPKLQERARERK